MITSILIDATHFGSDTPTGVEIYVQGLLPLLSEILLKRGCKVSWIGHQLTPPARMPKGVEWIHSAHMPFWGQVELPKLLRERRPNLFFTPSGIIPLGYGGMASMVVHDMAAYSVPESFSLGQKFRLRTLSKPAARRAHLIITPSNYTAKEVHSIWGVKTSQIRTISEAYEKNRIEAEAVDGLNGKSFFLFIGRLESKKNLLPLIEGFATLNDPELQLVLAGKEGYGSMAIHNLLASLPEKIIKNIIMPGYVGEGQKKWLYEHATAVVVPCLVEGFGIPILESFSYNVPVMCAKAGALPEVAQDAAYYVKGEISSEWEKGLREIQENTELRATLVKAGKKRLEDFSWEATARQTAEAFISL